MSLPSEVLKKVKYLEIRTRKIVNNLFSGEYHTVFKGSGMTFADFREYVPGDEIRAISWTVTARAGKPYIKRFEEERELNALLVVDMSGSGEFGTKKNLKSDVILNIAAVLGFSVARNQDHLGLLLYSDQVEHYVPPKKGMAQVQRILRDLIYFQPKNRGTNLALALETLRGLLKKKAIIFIISDFMDASSYEPVLKTLSQKHDVIAVSVEDPAESVPPPMGLVDLEDPETGEILTADFSNKIFREQARKSFEELKQRRDQILKRAQIDRISVNTEEDEIQSLAKFFQRRGRR